ncbi:MAG: hypothetical protein GF387_02085 [Candidatus Portnoybacteria bacterium]|nr:hypothetical protein [Candidatus Portnoybacteria bacterium]
MNKSEKNFFLKRIIGIIILTIGVLTSKDYIIISTIAIIISPVYLIPNKQNPD